MPPKYIDVDKLISDENEAYMSAQIKQERGGKNITALTNKAIHEKLLRILADAPIEDVVPVVHGKWMTKEYQYGDTERGIEDYWEERPADKRYDYAYCSVCGQNVLENADESYAYSNYCPYCGAKMDKDE